MYANLTRNVLGLRTYMRAQLPAALEAVSAEIGTVIPAPASDDHVIGLRETLTYPRHPAVFYPAASINPEAAGQHAGQSSAQMYPFLIDLVVTFKHSKPEQLELCLLGCSDAIANVFAADPSIGGVCDESEIEYLDWQHGDQDLGAVVAQIIMRSEIRA